MPLCRMAWYCMKLGELLFTPGKKFATLGLESEADEPLGMLFIRFGWFEPLGL